MTIGIDFSTWTEVDPATRVRQYYNVVVKNNVSEWTNLRRTEAATYVYKDYGYQYFEDFIHDFELRVESVEYSGMGKERVVALAYTNGIGAWYDVQAAGLKALGIMVEAGASDGKYKLSLVESYAGAQYQSDKSDDISDTTSRKYCTLEKNGRQIFLEVWNDAGRTEKIVDISFFLRRNHKLQYMEVPTSLGYSFGNNDNSDGWIGRLDLDPPTDATPENLFAKFSVLGTNSANLYASFTLKTGDTSLYAKFETSTVTATPEDFKAILTVGQSGSANLSAEFIVQQPTEDLKGVFTVRYGKANLYVRFHINDVIVAGTITSQLDTDIADILDATPTVTSEYLITGTLQTYADLKAVFIINNVANLKAITAIRQSATKDLKATFDVKTPGDLFAYFVVDQQGAGVIRKFGFEAELHDVDESAAQTVTSEYWTNLDITTEAPTVTSEYLITGTLQTYADLKGVFIVGGLANLKGITVIQHSATEDLKATFDVKSGDLFSKFSVDQQGVGVIRKFGFEAELHGVDESAAQTVTSEYWTNLDVTTEAPTVTSEYLITGTLLQTYVDLKGVFVVGGYGDLKGITVIQHSATEDLKGVFDILTPWDLFSKFSVDQQGAGVIRKFGFEAEIHGVDESAPGVITSQYLLSGTLQTYADLAAEFLVRQENLDLYAKFYIPIFKDLYAKFVVQRTATYDLFAKFFVKQSSEDLFAKFEIQASEGLFATFNVFTTCMQDFTTYTEVDPNSKLSQTKVASSWAVLIRFEDAYLYKKLQGVVTPNKPISFDFEFEITGYNAGDASNRNAGDLFGVTDAATGYSDYLRLALVQQAADNTQFTLRLRADVGGANPYVDAVNVQVGIKYFCTLSSEDNRDRFRLQMWTNPERSGGATFNITQTDPAWSGAAFDYIMTPRAGNYVDDPNDSYSGYLRFLTGVPCPADEDLFAEFIVRGAETVDLFAFFETYQAADLLAEFVVQHSATKDLYAEFIVRPAGTRDLFSELIVRQTGTAELFAKFEVQGLGEDLFAYFLVQQTGTEDLFADFTVRQTGTVDLFGYFVVQQADTADLFSEFIVQQTGAEDLYAEFIVRYTGARDLFAELIVRHTATKELFSEFVVRQTGTEDLYAEFTTRFSVTTDLFAELTVSQPGTADLYAELIVRQSAFVELFADFTVRHGDTKDLFAEFIIQHAGTAGLFAELVVQHTATKDLFAELIVRQAGSQDLFSELEVQQTGTQDLFAELVVRQPRTADLFSYFVAQQTGTQDLFAEFIVRQAGTQDLFSYFVVTTTQDASEELVAYFVVRHSDTENLFAELTVWPVFTEDLFAEVLIQHPGTRDLLGLFIVRYSAVEELFAELSVLNAGYVDISAEIVVRHTSTTNLAAALVIRHTGTPLVIFAEFTSRQERTEDLYARFYTQVPSESLFAKFLLRQLTDDLPAELVVRAYGTRDLYTVVYIRHPTWQWTNKRYLEGVISYIPVSDALLEYTIEGVMVDIQGYLVSNDLSYSWQDIRVVPTLIKRAATYGVVASLYARGYFDNRIAISIPPRTVTVLPEDRDGGMEYWEAKMDYMLALYSSSIPSITLWVDTWDEEPVFSMENIPLHSEDVYKEYK